MGFFFLFSFYILIFFCEGIPRYRSNGDGVEPVAQRIRGHDYKPQCQGLNPLSPAQKERTFPLPLGLGKS